jgi:hypothetical protein
MIERKHEGTQSIGSDLRDWKQLTKYDSSKKIFFKEWIPKHDIEKTRRNVVSLICRASILAPIAPQSIESRKEKIGKAITTIERSPNPIPNFQVSGLHFQNFQILFLEKYQIPRGTRRKNVTFKIRRYPYVGWIRDSIRYSPIVARMV